MPARSSSAAAAAAPPLAIAPLQSTEYHQEDIPMIVTRKSLIQQQPGGQQEQRYPMAAQSASPSFSPTAPTPHSGSNKRKRGRPSDASETDRASQELTRMTGLRPDDLINDSRSLRGMSASGSTPSSTSHNSGSPPSGAPTPSAAAGSPSQHAGSSIVQPSKEYVVPSRNKPGRKPIHEPPSAKRTAQNRASQRAFRERKQAHLAALEAKVAEYEAERVQGSLQLQRIAQKLKEENIRLQSVVKQKDKELTQWRDRTERIQNWIFAQGVSTTIPASVWEGEGDPRRRQVGCKAPAHEKATSKPPMVPIQVAQSPVNPVQAALPLIDPKESKNDCGFCVGQDLCICAAIDEAQSKDPVAANAPPAAPTTSAATGKGCAKDGGMCACMEKSAQSSNPVPISRSAEAKTGGDCGFCAGEGQCACKGDGIIDFDVADSTLGIQAESAIAAQKSVSSVPISLGLRSNGEKGKKKVLWSLNPTDTTSGAQDATQSIPIRHPGAAAIALPSSSDRAVSTVHRRLWHTYSGAGQGSASSKPVSGTTSAATCSGNPVDCAACSSDPVLAKFCEAVSERQQEPPNISPASFPLNQPYTTAAATVPEAFSQIRKHPHFPAFEGGLDLLADVVAGRSPTVAQPPALPPTSRSALVVPASPAAGQTTRSRESGLEALARIRALPSDSDARMLPSGSDGLQASRERQPVSLPSLSASTGSQGPDDHSPAIHPAYKRRRLYVDNDAVRSALSLLDRGALALKSRAIPPPCPCPWAGE